MIVALEIERDQIPMEPRTWASQILLSHPIGTALRMVALPEMFQAPKMDFQHRMESP